ncbi:LytTR family DNA-binding domain-containing protein [Aquimarina sp. M1]
MSSASYAFYIVNESTEITFTYYKTFLISFGLPFIPIVLPLWIYLRYYFGSIEIPVGSKKLEHDITILGDNKEDRLDLKYENFVYAQSQQNYVLIYLVDNNQLIQKIIRCTLSNLKIQIPHAWQVHRSFLVNLHYLSSVKGNTRKRYMTLTMDSDTIPISQKYYEALKKHISISSQKIQK